MPRSPWAGTGRNDRSPPRSFRLCLLIGVDGRDGECLIPPAAAASACGAFELAGRLHQVAIGDGEVILVDLVGFPVWREEVEAVTGGVGDSYVGESDDAVVSK